MNANNDKPYISPSRINMILRCAKQYEFRYVHNLIRPPDGGLIQGRAYHETLQRNLRQKRRTAIDLSLEEMRDTFAARFDFKVHHEELRLRDGERAGPLKDQGIAAVDRHHVLVAPTLSPRLVEQRFRVPLGESFPFDLLGVIDLVETSGAVVDHKLVGKRRSQADADGDLQLTAYSLAYRQLFGKVEPHLRLDTVVKTKVPRVEQIATTRTNAELRWYLGLVEQIAAQVLSGVFPPNPTGWWCSAKWCGYWDLCVGASKTTFHVGRKD